MWRNLKVKISRKCQQCNYLLLHVAVALIVTTAEKSHHTSGRGKEKVAILKYARAFCSS
jgi:hypothetical protein